MSKRTITPRFYLEDMLQYSNYILQFTSDITEETFQQDLRTQLAVTRAIEVLGEAAKRLLELRPNDMQLANLPLQKAYATRNRLMHGYDTVRLNTLWEISRNDIPPLIQELERLLANWSDSVP